MEPTEASDASLVDAAHQGDYNAFNTLAGRYQSLLLIQCRRLLNDPMLAQDAVQETFLHAFLHLDQLRQPALFGPWLCGIGRNICRRWLQSRAYNTWSWEALYGRIHPIEPLDEYPQPDELAEMREDADQLHRAIADLPEGQRAAVTLFYLADQSHQETAVTLGIEVGAVKTRLHNARTTLKQRLSSIREEQMIEPTHEPQFVRMVVADVRRVRIPHIEGRYLVILQEADAGERQISFWAGAPQGLMYAMLLQRAALLPVPFTSRLIWDIVKATGGRVEAIRITNIIDEVILAEIILHLPNGLTTLDATWGDAVGLALASDAPIMVTTQVIEIGGILDDHYADKDEIMDHANSEGAAEVVAQTQSEHEAELETIRNTVTQLGL